MSAFSTFYELTLFVSIQEHPMTNGNGVHEASNGNGKEIVESNDANNVEHQQASHPKRELALDLRYYMNRAPVTVRLPHIFWHCA